MEKIKQYHLHENDYSQLHFEVNEASPYCKKNIEHCMKPHNHSFYQLIWFQSAGRHYVDYQMIEHPENTIFFLNKGQIHYFCTESKNEGYLFHFNDFFLNKHEKDAEKQLSYTLFNEMGQVFVRPEKQELARITSLKDLILIELSEQKYKQGEQTYYLFQALLLLIERVKYREGSHALPDADYQLAVKFKHMIEQSLDKPYQVRDYSEGLHISPKKLTELSKKYLHGSPAYVIHQRKILEAKRLLSNTQQAIKEVAYSLGFDQPTYFTKYFKKHTGFTPKEFIGQLP